MSDRMIYGVCNCNLGMHNPTVSNLETFQTYEEAFNRYLTRAMKSDKFGYVWDATLWYVWIEDGRVVQFEQLGTRTKSRIVEIKD